MPCPPRRCLVGLCFAVALAIQGWVGWAGSTGAAGWHHAGVVVRTGDGRLTYAYVAFPEQTISSIELLRRTGIPLVTVGFGGLGEGVCSLAGEGCPASDCRQRLCQGLGRDSPYWQFFREAAPGAWQSMSLGPSATRVHDGDVDGWSWTASAAKLPGVALSDVARLTGVGAAEIGASVPADGGPTPAVRTVYPAGVAPAIAESGQGWGTYLAAGGVLGALGGAALYAARRRGGRGTPS